MAATPQELLTDANCFNCYGATPVQMMRLSLLVQILTSLDPMAATDPQSLLTYGNCFPCYGASIVDTIELALLDQIAAASSGGGGSGGRICGTDPDPNGVVTGDQCDEYIDTNLKTRWIKESAGTGNTGWTLY